MPAPDAGPTAVARALVGSALRVRRGEHLAVLSWNHTLPFATACVTEARRVGARPFLVLEDEVAFWQSVRVAPAAARGYGLSRPLLAAIVRSDALVYFPGPADRPRLHALPAAALAGLRGASDDEWLARTRRAGNRGVRCLLGYVSDEQADAWSVPAAMWRSQLMRGITEVDYGALGRDAVRVARLLRTGRSLRLTAANGTDLTVRLRGRTPWVDDGRIDSDDRRHGRTWSSAPAGSVVVAVEEGSAEGTVVGNRPSFLASGRVAGAQWEVERGRLRNYWYTEGAPTFEAEFAAAPRGHDVVSLVSVGLNSAVAPGVPRAEDEEAGAVTVAIGGNSLYGGRLRCRFLSWITVGEATVTVDGHPLADRGKIL
jgi:leucyl aminopeptidase (aminopeptidase T)